MFSSQNEENEIAKLSVDELQQQLRTLAATLEEKTQILSKPLPDEKNWDVKEFIDTPVFRALTTTEPVLKLEHKTKNSGNVATAPKGITINISNYHPTLSTIKINNFINVRKTKLPRLPLMVITFVDKAGTRSQFYINDEGIVSIAKKLVSTAMPLNLGELTLAKFQEASAYPAEVWETDWDHADRHGLWYDRVNDPMILKTLNDLIPKITLNVHNEKLVIVDVGAGKGRLAEKIINELLRRNIPVHYIFLEPNEVQFKQAQQKLNSSFAGQQSNGTLKLEFHNAILLNANLNTKAHGVISSGGPIDLCIVSRETANEHLKKMEQCLLPGGYLIATGITGIIVKNKSIRATGLFALSFATPIETPPGLENHQFIKMAEGATGFFGKYYQRLICQKPQVNAQENNFDVNFPVNSPKL